MTEPRAHALAGPSGASRWMNCPASVTLARDIPPQPSSPYAREGTAAHFLAETVLRGLPEPAEIMVDGESIPIDYEMKKACGIYVTYADMLRYGADGFWIEKGVSLDWLYEPEPMPEPIYGTADCIAICDDTLHVIDFKYGKGHAVKAEGNPQLRIYAIGALPLANGFVKKVTMTIVQPRTPGNPFQSETLSIAELGHWRRSVLYDAIERLGDNDPTENPGQWCHWCPRKSVCGAMQAKKQEKARAVFDEIQD